MTKSLKNRFDKGYKINPINGCWEWQGYLNKGYGYLGVRNRKLNLRFNHKASRVSWTIYNGEIPDEHVICHSCDNPKCVNPKHLFLGTQYDNLKDMTDKGRRFKFEGFHGEEHGRAKLTAEEVKLIRDSKIPNKILSLQYNVTSSLIGQIKRRVLWKHLE